MSVRLSTHFDVVIRKSSLQQRGVQMDRVRSIMEAPPQDEDGDLLSFGPHFGEEAGDEFVRRLKAAGLEYPDDFFVFFVEVPEWCGMACFSVP